MGLNIVISQQVARHAAKKQGVGSNKLRLFFVGWRKRERERWGGCTSITASFNSHIYVGAL